ncbi:MAG: pyridoxal phosphate-dependent aminotransferase [Vicinamibacterales bacterium]
MTNTLRSFDMSLSRRSFVRTLGVGAAGAWIGARGREASLFSFEQPVSAAERIILSSNENPLGPGQAVLNAVRGAFGLAGRYPFATANDVAKAIAERQKVKLENVLLGVGSTQILRTCTHVFTSKDRALATALPAYEECSQYAELVGAPVRGVSLDSNFYMDLDAFHGAAKGAGLVFYCNPNNPVATAVDGRSTRDFIERVLRDSPDTTILVDEAYFDYATLPGYETMIPLAVENPRVVVARTFSKAGGMAGLRIGYGIGHPQTIRKMAQWDATGSINVLALAAAHASITQDASVWTTEAKRNNEARAYTMTWFADRGFKPTDSQTNFLFVNVKRPVREFRDACREQGVLVARDFPPFEKSHCRISIGTMEEMRRATEVFGRVLGAPVTAAA